MYSVKNLIIALLALDPRVLALWYALQPRILSAPSTILSMNDIICLIDAFGYRRVLQYATHKHFEVFSLFLAHDYKNTPAAQFLKRGRYRLTNAKVDELQAISRDSWSSTVRPGSVLVLSVILDKFFASRGSRCPLCGSKQEWKWMVPSYVCSCGVCCEKGPERLEAGMPTSYWQITVEHSVKKVSHYCASLSCRRLTATKRDRLASQFPYLESDIHPTRDPPILVSSSAYKIKYINYTKIFQNIYFLSQRPRWRYRLGLLPETSI